MTQRALHAMDVWRNTALVSEGIVPYCSQDSDCVNQFKAAFIDGTQREIDRLSTYIFCYSHVSVPKYYEQAFQKNASDSHLQQSNLVFEHKVCSCDQAAFYEGDQCEPNVIGIVLRGMVYFTFFWIFLLFLQVCNMIKTQNLKTLSKRALRVFALFQFLGQLIWLTGVTQFSFLFREPGLDVVLQGIGIITCIIAQYMFCTGMVLQTTVFLRKTLTNEKDESMKRKLHVVDRAFMVLPLFVGSATAYLISTQNMSLLVGLVSIAAIFVTWAFIVIARLLDKRIRRLLPRVAAGNARNRQVETQNDSSVSSLLNSSKKLRKMANSLRNAAARNILASWIHGASLFISNARWRWLSPVALCVMHICFSLVPMIGVAGLNAMNVVSVRLKTRISVHPGNSSSNVESSDVGTLGS